MQLPAALTLAQTPQAVVALQSALAQAGSGAPFVVDAAALTEFDTSAIALLLEARRLALQRGLTFAVQNPPAKLHQLVALYGLEELLDLQAAPA